MNTTSWITFVTDRLPELWLRTGEHLMLTGCATILALLIGMPLGILVFKNTWLRGPTLAAVGILQTIPSLAMLVFLLAILQKIGVLPAIIALTLYALLPIVRNTFAGLSGVSPQVMEAAKGIGMTSGQRLRLVRLPLATPVIVAGIRTAAVVSVGIATLSAFIGAGGLGQFINRGLALYNTRLILLGAVPAALLALLVDFSIGAFEWGLRPQRKQEESGSGKAFLRRAALFMPLLLIALAFLSYFTQPSAGFRSPTLSATGRITVATKNFTEQLILGELMAQMLETHTDLRVNRRFNLGGTMICHGALVNGEIDLYAEYTGTGLTVILKDPVISDPEAALKHVTDAYRRHFDAQWLEPFGFNNTYAITVRAEDAERYGWRTISDLKEAAPTLRAGFTAEFAERPDGYPGLREAYGFGFGDIRDLDPSLMYEAVSKGEVDVICAFATDGRIAAYHLMPLRDDRRFFPPYHAAPVVRGEILEHYPEVKESLFRLKGVLDDKTMQRLNFEVDGKKRNVARVAGEFLREKGLIQ
ncbi:MAG: glycine betaine ABC transporter substrate-binding protein [Deltaproteobacteria bacterium]|nr:glycine betaine ABC transporter substrate-binding protein [Deltaproteobacteria bacterium]